MKGICDSIDVFELGLLDFCGSVNCGEIGIEVSRIGECGQIDLFWICNFCYLMWVFAAQLTLSILVQVNLTLECYLIYVMFVVYIQ